VSFVQAPGLFTSSAHGRGRLPGADWQPGGGTPRERGKGADGPCRGIDAGPEDGPRAWAAGARALDLGALEI